MLIIYVSSIAKSIIKTGTKMFEIGFFMTSVRVMKKPLSLFLLSR